MNIVQLVQTSSYKERITKAWRSTIEGVLETGRLLNDAKRDMPHGSFIKMVESELPFVRETAFRLMAIAKDKRFVAHGQHLPVSWRTLYELTKLPDDVFDRAIAEGAIHPDMERKDATQLMPPTRSAPTEPSESLTQQVYDLFQRENRPLADYQMDEMLGGHNGGAWRKKRSMLTKRGLLKDSGETCLHPETGLRQTLWVLQENAPEEAAEPKVHGCDLDWEKPDQLPGETEKERIRLSFYYRCDESLRHVDNMLFTVDKIDIDSDLVAHVNEIAGKWMALVEKLGGRK